MPRNKKKYKPSQYRPDLFPPKRVAETADPVVEIEQVTPEEARERVARLLARKAG